MQKTNDPENSYEAEQFRKMFIGGLSTATSDEALREYYSQWGEILDCVVMRDPITRRSRGFGFVSYKSQTEVDLAMANRPHIIDGKTVDPKRAVPRDQSVRSEANVSSKRLYVSGVREEHTEQMFQDYFSKFGTVVKVEIIADKVSGKPRGFAFVSFEDYDPVDKCVLLRSHYICNYRCDVKKALSKEEMGRERDRSERMLRSRGTMRMGQNRYGSGGPHQSYDNWNSSSAGQWGGTRSNYYGGYEGNTNPGYGNGTGWNNPHNGPHPGWNNGPPGNWGAPEAGGGYQSVGNQSGWGQGCGNMGTGPGVGSGSHWESSQQSGNPN